VHYGVQAYGNEALELKGIALGNVLTEQRVKKEIVQIIIP
jgi:hypothetical protein